MAEKPIKFYFKLWSSRTCFLTAEEKGICFDAVITLLVNGNNCLNHKNLARALRITPNKLKKCRALDRFARINEETGFFEATNFSKIFFDDEKRRHISKEKREAVWDKTGGFCHYCETNLYRHAGPSEFHVDHVIPFIEGGSDELSNLVPACRTCNLKKGSNDSLHDLPEGVQ